MFSVYGDCVCLGQVSVEVPAVFFKDGMGVIIPIIIWNLHESVESLENDLQILKTLGSTFFWNLHIIVPWKITIKLVQNYKILDLNITKTKLWFLCVYNCFLAVYPVYIPM